MPFAEDLSVFMSTAEFATQAILAGVSVSGIFDNGNAQGNVGLAGMATTQPTYVLPTASAVGSVVGNTLQLGSYLGGTTYRVAEQLPDGTGLTTLVLEAA